MHLILILLIVAAIFGHVCNHAHEKSKKERQDKLKRRN